MYYLIIPCLKQKNIKRQKEARKEGGEEREGEGRGYEKKGGKEEKKIEKSF